MTIRLADLRYRYPGAPADALTGVSAAFAPGELAWLHGAPGAGCSTLLLALAGLAPRLLGGTRTGEVLVLGGDPAATPALLGGPVAAVLATPAQQLSGIAETVADEVAFTPANLQWPRARIAAAVEEALERLGVAHLADRHPLYLSGGEQQRVVLAAMAALAPLVWLLDEPAAALDGDGRARLARLLREEAARGATVLVASEDVDVMAGLADRLLVLRDGALVADEAPAAFLAAERAWTLGTGGTTAGELARSAAVAGAPLAAPWPLTTADLVARVPR